MPAGWSDHWRRHLPRHCALRRFNRHLRGVWASWRGQEPLLRKGWVFVVLSVILKGHVTFPLGTVMGGSRRASPTGVPRTLPYREVLYPSLLRGVPIPPWGNPCPPKLEKGTDPTCTSSGRGILESAHGFHHTCNALVRLCLDLHNIYSSKLAWGHYAYWRWPFSRGYHGDVSIFQIWRLMVCEF